MRPEFETLALKFAPELYYVESQTFFENIIPEDMGGLYWRLIESSVAWADVCIQYIVYFKCQRWTPSIFDRFSGKLPGEHPNDYVPIFLYLRKGRPVRVVFDICHYEAVGAINAPSPLLPPDRGPLFQVKYFFRGLLPLDSSLLGDERYINLRGSPTPLSLERLTHWWEGFTWSGSFDEKAILIIKEKFEKPFQKITTFRDRASKLGFLFHWIFRSALEFEMQRLPLDTYRMASEIGVGMGEKAVHFSHDDITEAARFANGYIFEKSKVPEYLTVRKL